MILVIHIWISVWIQATEKYNAAMVGKRLIILPNEIGKGEALAVKLPFNWHMWVKHKLVEKVALSPKHRDLPPYIYVSSSENFFDFLKTAQTHTLALH